MQEPWVRSLSPEDPQGEGMAARSSVLARRIPWKRSLEGYSLWGRKESDMTEATESMHIYIVPKK